MNQNHFYESDNFVDSSVKTEIRRKLREIEEVEHVKILFAVESGSRAWGISSVDSDYDVRFVYMREKEEYLRLDRTRDVIEWQLDDVFDINGWDIQKALRLLHDSNPTLLEWIQSPIVYISSDGYEEFGALANQYFDQRKSFLHYLYQAHDTYSKYLTEQHVRYKKYFYVLRSILAARWILHRASSPLIVFDELQKAELHEKDVSEIVNQLLEKKKQAYESTKSEKIELLNHFIEEELASLKQLGRQQRVQYHDWQALNLYFRKLLEMS